MSGPAAISAQNRQNNGLMGTTNGKTRTIHSENVSNGDTSNSNGGIVKNVSNATGRIVTAPLGMVSIQDLETGKVDLDAVLAEVKSLRKKISQLRYEMCQYFITLSSIDDNTIPSVVYNQVAAQVNTLQKSCNAYLERYKNLLPIIRYAKLKRGMGPNEEMKVVKHEVPVNTAKAAKAASSGKGGKQTGTTKKGRGRKRKKNDK
ncbi:hypothetical protein BRETT_004387 [Brettanomyces bruxellensis]|uniref:Uncharacterized protein n=1 Tax=Dekkera bruxellensis TaxID=5007 RepID=A0A871R1Y9_DEKBR|nr:uncharacterized protein BRETT_004387 [Brettanomyces bruxellensis]QOU19166.1 hypothetical protein BRETT_004387 [Brettanomyces bruxellensis]